METIKRFGYYNPTKVITKRKDLSSDRLKELKEEKEFKQALLIVVATFIAIGVFAIWASNNIGSSYF